MAFSHPRLSQEIKAAGQDLRPPRDRFGLFLTASFQYQVIRRSQLRISARIGVNV